MYKSMSDRLARYKYFDQVDRDEIAKKLDSTAADLAIPPIIPASMARNVLKYGDWFYFSDSETHETVSIHPSLVHASVTDNDSLEVLGWIVSGLKILPKKHVAHISFVNNKINVGTADHTATSRWPFGYSLLEDLIEGED